MKHLKTHWRGLFLVAAFCFTGLAQSHPIFNTDMTTPICQSADGLNRFGVNEPLGWPGLYPTDRLETSLGMMEDAGIGWVRVNFAWKDMQPDADAAFDCAHMDEVVRVATEHHIQLLGILLAVPEWSSSAPPSVKSQYGSQSPVDHYRPQKLQDWLTYVQNVVERYDGDGVNDAPGSPQIHDWEVWNEPNLSFFWPPNPDASEYFNLLKATDPVIKAADSSAKVVLGGLANAGINNDGSSYLKALYDLGAAPYFDIASVHLYTYPPNGIAPLQNTMQSVRKLMDDEGDTAKPIWLTEVGWSDAPNAWGAPTVSQDDMAAFVTAVYSTPLPVDVIFWYNFRNIFANSPDPEHNFGLVNADFSPKPAFKAYEVLSALCKSPTGAAASAGSG